ncbi:uncharacterized protein LOC141758868 isoform X2 [Sebastes fasciatus]|uniref:uncharacterized protein LOC141758868 isoform X2 n=1 Tax=Sebastes fasciatus TaxID=394691 RepID=UPI003D9F0AEB
MMNTGVSLYPEQEQRDDSEPGTQDESNWETPEQKFRIQQLHNRRFLLLKMKHFKKKAEDNGVWTTEEMTCEDSDQLCELEAIQKELDELLAKKELLEKKGNRSELRANEGQQDAYNSETPRGGIYTLPPAQLTQEDIPLEGRVKTKPVAERPTDPVVPGNLGRTPAVTKCPSCEEVIITETRSRVGEASWMLCFLCTLTGCVAGCCLIPFCVKRMRNVHHRCPRCQANVHTHRPF